MNYAKQSQRRSDYRCTDTHTTFKQIAIVTLYVATVVTISTSVLIAVVAAMTQGG